MKRLLGLALAVGMLAMLGGCVYDPAYYHRPGVVYDDGSATYGPAGGYTTTTTVTTLRATTMVPRTVRGTATAAGIRGSASASTAATITVITATWPRRIARPWRRWLARAHGGGHGGSHH